MKRDGATQIRPKIKTKQRTQTAELKGTSAAGGIRSFGQQNIFCFGRGMPNEAQLDEGRART